MRKTGTLHKASSFASRVVACLLTAAPACIFAGCGSPNATASNDEAQSAPAQPTASSRAGKIGVLLVSHGSRSQQWCRQVLGIESQVADELLEDGRIAGVRSALMEYSEPSIATQLKKFDEEGYTNVILVPLLLTVSSHSFDDIPTIIGQKRDHATAETLRVEGIDIYKPKARVTVAPLLDFPEVLGENVIGRASAMSREPDNEGIVLVAYGSEPYEEEWTALLEEVARETKAATGLDCVEWAWCGQIVRYRPEPTEEAIRRVRARKERALVIPVLVAVDEMFQGEIIGGAVEAVAEPERIVYRHDSILPDESVNRWIVEISKKQADEIDAFPKHAGAPSDRTDPTR